MTEPPQKNEANPTAVEGQGTDWDEDVYPTEEVRELMTTFTKTLRAFQLYDENNPVYQRFVGSLTQGFAGLWNEVDRLPLTVQEDRLFYRGEEVYRETNRSESMAFLLYKDGIREVVFLPGVEEGELEPLLSVLQKARNLRQEEDDLLTLLWTADLEQFRYTYIDLMTEGMEMPEVGDGAEPGQLEAVMEGEVGEAQEEAEEEEEGEPGSKPPPGQVSKEDFNPTLYSLDPNELEELQEEVEKEMARELRADVLSALFDRLEEPGHGERQVEILSILRSLLPNLLSHGALDAAARVLGELKSMRQAEEVFDPDAEARIEGILDEVSSPDSIQELVRALEDGTVQASAGELSAFLQHLRGGALAPLLRASELTEVKELKPILREAVQGIARGNKKALAALLDSPDTVVLAGAARLVGDMEVAEGAAAVAQLLQHSSSQVRLAAVEAARSLNAPSTTGALPAALKDPDREVRVAAARALGHLGYAPAASRFKELIEGKEIRQADITEKIAIFESYGQLGDSDAVKILGGLLNGRGFLGRKEPAEVRAAAALGLGKVGTPEAREELSQAQNEDDPVIRSAVSRALRGGEE